MPQQTLRIAVSILTALLIGIALPAHASKEATQEAKRHFKQAQKSYSSGDHAGALSSFEKAYALRPLPGFLFNMAQCHSKLNQPAKAHALYAQYLKEHPKAQNKALVKSLMAEAQAKADASRALAAKEAKAKLPPPPPPAPALAKKTPAPAPKTPVVVAQARPTAPVVAKPKAKAPKKPTKVSKKAADPMALELVPIVPKVAPVQPVPQASTAPAKTELPLVNIAKLTDTKAIYERWWFWSVAGSVVAASVGAILYANHSTEDVVVLPSGTLGRVDQR